VKKNSIALITGGSRGIGAAIAQRLADDGYDIWLNYKSNSKAAENIKKSIEKKGQKCELLKFDVTSKEEIDEVLVSRLETEIPDVLVNNAGILKDALLVWMSVEEWQSVINTTLLGFFLVTKSVLLGMLKRKSGRIINIASTTGEAGVAGQVNYSAAKAGLIGATKALAKEVSSKGIYVNAVSPGFIDTDMISHIPKENLIKNIPIKRTGKPSEIAGIVSFLCSGDADYITGQVISANGGSYI
jgi:3-oxoacyl-[acyl-carrier protein] reductase